MHNASIGIRYNYIWYRYYFYPAEFKFSLQLLRIKTEINFRYIKCFYTNNQRITKSTVTI